MKITFKKTVETRRESEDISWAFDVHGLYWNLYQLM